MSVKLVNLTYLSQFKKAQSSKDSKKILNTKTNAKYCDSMLMVKGNK